MRWSVLLGFSGLVGLVCARPDFPTSRLGNLHVTFGLAPGALVIYYPVLQHTSLKTMTSRAVNRRGGIWQAMLSFVYGTQT